MSLYVHELLSRCLVKAKGGYVPCKGTVVCASQVCAAFKFPFIPLLHLIRRSHRNASHLFFAACVERSAPTIFLITVKTYDLEDTHRR